MRARQAWLGMFGAVALGAACRPAPSPPPPEEPAAVVDEAADRFGPERVAARWDALERCGARETGGASAACARDAIAGALRAMGVEPTEQRASASAAGGPAVEIVNLLGTVPGAAPDLVLLVAPYSAGPGAARRGAGSGAALLLELARALAVRGYPYTLRLAFVDGDPLAGGPGSAGSAGLAFAGSAALAQALDEAGELPRVRFAVYFDGLAVPDLRVARDLLSSRSHREAFWASARRLGRADAFPPDGPFEAVASGQMALVDHGMRRTVALVASDEAASAGGSLAVADARTPEESLAIAGEVSLEGLAALGARLEKIDRFAAPRAAAAPEETR